MKLLFANQTSDTDQKINTTIVYQKPKKSAYAAPTMVFVSFGFMMGLLLIITGIILLKKNSHLRKKQIKNQTQQSTG